MKHIFEERKLVLGQLPTPIVKFRELPNKVQLYLKRDDKIDQYGTGTKLRKLEYVLHHAKTSNCTDLIIDGFSTSNSCLATSIYGNEIGLNVSVLIKDGDKQLKGSKLSEIKRVAHRVVNAFPNDIESQKKALAAKIESSRFRSVMVVPTGISNAPSILGMLELVQEINDFEIRTGTTFNYVVLPVGTGGSVIGLEIGRIVTKSDWVTVGVMIDNYSRSYYTRMYQKLATEAISMYALPPTILDDSLRLFKHPLDLGYQKFLNTDVNEIQLLYKQTGVYFDTTYMFKALKCTKHLASTRYFESGSNILLIHTGGLAELLHPPYQ